jgi:hypothetical protein
MVAYNFRREHEPRIKAGIKTTTIRARGRKRHARPGELTQPSVGLRTAQCRKIISDPWCRDVQPSHAVA